MQRHHAHRPYLALSKRFTGFGLCLLCALGHPAASAQTLRVANNSINVPSSPPAPATEGYGLVEAFPGLSFEEPTCLATPPGETTRLFVCQKRGLLRVIPDVTAPVPQALTFLDLRAVTKRDSESGLLGVAFHPNFAANRYFYVFYTNSAGARTQRVSRFTASATNPNTVVPGSELILIDQADERDNHNGGDLHFGPDGYLYISVGDEGGANDQYNNSQTITKDLFAGILRIDVDRKPGNIEPTPHPAIPLDNGVARFSIPVDNPFVHTSAGGAWDGKYNGVDVTGLDTVRREFFATGLRNPWRISFDRTTGELWCGDVGQNAREEIDIITKGGNYGWAYREGKIAGSKSAQMPADFLQHHTQPIYDYTRGGGALQGYSVTGGLVYRGTRLPALTGRYIFGDYVSGNIWSLQRNEANAPTVTRLTSESGITAFGSDPSNSDVLLADFDNGRILRLTNLTTGDFPATLSATGLFSNLAALEPAPGLIPYGVNLPFWSDHAIKRRWFMIPDGSSQFSWAENAPWSFPAGMLWVKHFDIEMQRGNPASSKRIETRLLVRNSTGAYGVSYRWNDGGTEATLVADTGEDFVLNITENGQPAPQTWHIPGRAECMTCHTPQAGHALSFNTRQLNLSYDMAGFQGNQLDILREQGFFSNPPPPAAGLPHHIRPDESQFSREDRVRSYLDVNCAYCHMDGSGIAMQWDARAHLSLEATGLVNGIPLNDGGDPLNRLVVPGDPGHSVILHRMAASNGFTRMPQLATNVIDQANIELLTAWILNDLSPGPLTLGSASRTVDSPGGTYDLEIITAAEWTWSIEGGAGWLTSGEASPQTGNQTFTYQVAPNTGATSRTATIFFTAEGSTRSHVVTSLPAGPPVPLAVASWQSLNQHGPSLGTLPVPASGFVEPRSPGLRRLAVTFSKPVVLSNPTGILTVAGRNVAGTIDLTSLGIQVTASVDGNTVHFEFSDSGGPRSLPDAARWRFTLNPAAITGTDGATLAASADTTRELATLAGDTNGNGRVSGIDLNRIANSDSFDPADSAAVCADVDCNGIIDETDRSAAWANRSKRIDLLPPPP